MTTRSQSSTARAANDEEVQLLLQQVNAKEKRINDERRALEEQRIQIERDRTALNTEKERAVASVAHRLEALEREKHEAILAEQEKTRQAFARLEGLAEERSNLEASLNQMQQQLQALQEHVQHVPVPQEAPVRTPPPRGPSHSVAPEPNSPRSVSTRILSRDTFLNPRELIDTLPSFNGNIATVHQFSKSCAEVADLLHEYPAKILIRSFKNKLSGDARNLMCDIDFQTVEEFLDLLKRTFSSYKSLNDYRGELANLIQNPGENIMQYAARTKNLRNALLDAADQKYHGTPQYLVNEIEEDVLESFIRGMNYYTRLEVRAARCYNLTEAITQAIRISREHSATQNLRNLTPRKSKLDQNPNEPSLPNPPAVNVIPKPLPAAVPPIQAPVNPISTPDNICKYCKNPGHTIQTCRKLTYKNSLQSNQCSVEEEVNFQVMEPPDEPDPCSSTSSN